VLAVWSDSPGVIGDVSQTGTTITVAGNISVSRLLNTTSSSGIFLNDTGADVTWGDGVAVVRNATCLKMSWNSTSYVGVGPGC
jgi:hypothetical protein